MPVLYVVRRHPRLSIGILVLILASAATAYFATDRYFSRHGYYCDTITLDGNITGEVFVATRECLQNSFSKSKRFVINSSGGGDAEAAIALAMLIHKRGWDVEVKKLCASACANYLFPAGRSKYLHENALLLFHGGPDQSNMRDHAKALDRLISTKPGQLTQVAQSTKPVQRIVFGHVDREGTVFSTPPNSPATTALRTFLGVERYISAERLMEQLIVLTNSLYSQLGVNKLLPTYGQTGKYERLYKSYQYSGFTYSINALNRFGVNDIRFIGRGWHPELHPAYKEVYPVDYP